VAVAHPDLDEDQSGSTPFYARQSPAADLTEVIAAVVAPPGEKTQVAWWLKALVVAGAVLMVISGGSLALLYGLSSHYDSKVAREDILAEVPTVEDDGNQPMNFLILGSDSRADKDIAGIDETGSRSDTIMLLHVNKERTAGFIVSIPRDSYVNIPPSGKWRGGKNKINASLAFGGASLAAKTVYDLTKIPLNGAIIINFNGIQNMVRAVGGVNVCTPFTVRSQFSSRVWAKGCHDMTPSEVEEFVRQRKFVPGGDLGRIKSQQNVIKGLMKKVTTTGVLTNPARLDDLITAAAESLTVDESLNLRDLAFSLKGINPNNVKFATTPIVGTMQTEVGSSIELDMPAAQQLFTAMIEDKTDEWLAANPQPDVASF
jgi:LCP family protein required for cell wall assembly